MTTMSDAKNFSFTFVYGGLPKKTWKKCSLLREQSVMREGRSKFVMR